MAHIGIDARLTHYRVGGISRYIMGIISAMEEYPLAHKVTVFQSRKARRALSRRFASANLWTPPHHLLERGALSVELLRRRLDLLHSPDFIAPMRGARRHVITVHDLSFIHYPEYMTPESRRYYNGQIQASVMRSDHILADSFATKQDVVDILDVPPEKITVHHLGVEDVFRPLPRSLTKPVITELDLPESYLLFVGTVEPRKNLVGLARAYRDLKLEMPDLPKLLVAGRPGWHFEQLMRDITKVGINDSLIFRHDISDSQLPALYNHALMLILPSHYEGFGLPALEAMACGTAPIVSNVASLPEIVGDVGILVDPRDLPTISGAMQRVLVDSAWRAAQSEAGIERAKRFRWEAAAQTVLDVYQAVLN
ncbi:MAG: glycosyltransferase family 1 protein [Chloroflexota bacterium]|nr:glycosyltransferase family 1 protein [Chloroflexota bacterium]